MEKLREYLLEEIDELLISNWDDEIQLNDDEKEEIVDDITEYSDSLEDYIVSILLPKMEEKFKDKYEYLYAKDKVCGLDDEERYDFNVLSGIYKDMEGNK